MCPGVGLVDHMGALFLDFWGNSTLFSIGVAPNYILVVTYSRYAHFDILLSQIKYAQVVFNKEKTKQTRQSQNPYILEPLCSGVTDCPSQI